MSFESILQDTNERVLKMLNDEYEETQDLERLGLDHRSAYTVFVSNEGIVVHANQDRMLQYYGGFEYVDKEYRMVLGDWVFYSSEDSRVDEHLQRYFANDAEDDGQPDEMQEWHDFDPDC